MRRFLYGVVLFYICVSISKAFSFDGPHLSFGLEHIRLTYDEAKKINDTLVTFTQKVDHFDPNNNDTYLQRYGVNVTFYKPGGPIFILIGNEGTLSERWTHLERSYWVNLAKEAGAMMFTLEHRFYGYSWPKPDLSLESLKYQTSRQALADLNAFILAQNVVFNLTNPKWITFGGSYGGSLSAWARMKYPDTIYAAVASSAPIEAVVDFSAFLEVVSDVLYSFNEDCAKSIHRGFLAIQSELKTAEGQEKLNRIFDFHQSLKSPEAVVNLYSTILGVFMGFIQYGDGGSGYNATLTKICELEAADAQNPLEGLANVYAFFRRRKFLSRNVVPNNHRAWVWQTCSEFGFYSSTGSKKVANNFVPDVIPVMHYVNSCKLTYGDMFSNNTVYSNVDSTNSYYYGRKNYNGTRVLFVNGKNDPWHTLSILEPREGIETIVVKGVGHCADMLTDNEGDVPEIKEARKKIHETVIKWVKE